MGSYPTRLQTSVVIYQPTDLKTRQPITWLPKSLLDFNQGSTIRKRVNKAAKAI